MKLLTNILIILFIFPSILWGNNFDPNKHREILRMNVDRSATLQMVSRNPARFKEFSVGFEGRILKIKETGRRKFRTWLLCTNLKKEFITRVDGRSDRFTEGMWVESYGKIKLWKNPFNLSLPVVGAVRVLTPEEVSRDYVRKKDLNIFLMAVKNGGFLALGNRFFKEKKYRDSEVAFKFGLQYDRKNPDSLYYYKIALSQFMAGKFKEAEDSCRNSIHRDMYRGEAQLLYGKIFIELKNYPLAKKYLSRAIKLKSKGNPWKYMGKANLLEGNPLKASKYIEIAMTEDPMDYDIMLDAGNMYVKLGYMEIAVKYLEKYLEKYPDSKSARINYTLAKRYLKKVDRKINTGDIRRYDKLLVEAFALLGREYFPLKDKKGYKYLEDELIWAAKFKTMDYRIYNFLGLLKMYNKRYDEAEIYFKRAVERERKLPELYYNLAFASYFLDKFDESIINFTKAYKLDSLMERGIRYRKMVEKVSELINKRKLNGRMRSTIHRNYGDYLSSKKEYDTAEFQYRESYKYNRDNLNAIFNLIYIYRIHQNKDKMLHYLKILASRSNHSRKFHDDLLKIGFTEKELKKNGFRIKIRK